MFEVKRKSCWRAKIRTTRNEAYWRGDLGVRRDKGWRKYGGQGDEDAGVDSSEYISAYDEIISIKCLNIDVILCCFHGDLALVSHILKEMQNTILIRFI